MHTTIWRWTKNSIWLVLLCVVLGEFLVLTTRIPVTVTYNAPQTAMRTIFPYISEIEYENGDVNGRAFRWLPNKGDIRLVGGSQAPMVVRMHVHTGRPADVPTQFTMTYATHTVLTTRLAPGWRTVHLLVPYATWHDGYATVQYTVTGNIPNDRRLLGLAVDTVTLQPTMLPPVVWANWAYWLVLLGCAVLLTMRTQQWGSVVAAIGVTWLVQWVWPLQWSLYMPTLWSGSMWLVVLCLMWALAPYRRQLFAWPVALGITTLSLVILRSPWPWLGAIGIVLVWFGCTWPQIQPTVTWSRRWIYVMVGVSCVVAVLLRVPGLDQFPQGMFRDEARHAGLAQQIIAGSQMVYSPFANLPAGYFYLSAVPIQWFGPSAFAIRISAALLGVLTVPLAFWALRAWWGASYAALVSVVLSTLLWHIGLSRIGFPASAGPLLTLLAVGLLYRALTTPAQRRSLVYAGVAGCATGAMTLGYHSARLMPLVVVAMIVAVWYEQRWMWRSRLPVLVVWAMLTAVAAFPIVWYAITESYNYMKRIDSTSITGLAMQEGIPLLVAIARNLVAYLGALTIAGDRNARHFYMGMPQLNISEGIAFLTGIVALWVQRSARIWWIGWYLLVAFVPGMLSVDAPHALRTVEATIPVAMIVAYGMWVLLAYVNTRWQPILIMVVLLATATWSGITYVQWQRDDRAYAEFDGQLTQAIVYVQHHYALAQAHATHWVLPQDWRDGDVGVYLLHNLDVGRYRAGVLEPSPAPTQLVLLPRDADPPVGAQALTLPDELRAHNDVAIWCVGACADVQWIR